MRKSPKARKTQRQISSKFQHVSYRGATEERGGKEEFTALNDRHLFQEFRRFPSPERGRHIPPIVQNFCLGTDLKVLSTQVMCLELDSVKHLKSINSHNDMTHNSV